jgi:16S rRNA G966 N2-methylase RsmD
VQLDDKFQTEGEQFVAFDFREPQRIPAALHQSFDLVVIDPPFITRDVWELYAQAARLLARTDPSVTGGTKVLLTTIRTLRSVASIARERTAN